MNTEIYDVLIIGAGQAGVPLASSLAAAGQKIALAERKQLGTKCHERCGRPGEQRRSAVTAAWREREREREGE